MSFKASQDARRGPETAVLGKRTFFRDCGLRGSHRITRVFRDNALLLQGQQEASAFPRFQDLSSRGIGLFPVSFWGPALRVMGARLPGPGAPRPLLLQLGVTKVTYNGQETRGAVSIQSSVPLHRHPQGPSVILERSCGEARGLWSQTPGLPSLILSFLPQHVPALIICNTGKTAQPPAQGCCADEMS